MGRYDVLIKCAQVRKLIEENKYKKALEVLDDLDLSRVHAMGDLTLFAKVYEKADRFEEAMNIYTAIYEKKHSKRILYQLILLVLRIGKMEEAQELYQEYESVAGVTLDTYELRYRMAKAQGVGRDKLIVLLEELRKEEFTEEWGYQLAKLYELQGDRKHCIEVCEDIVLWFGSGAIVDQAKELRNEVSQPDWQPPKDMTIPEPMQPDPDEEVPISYAVPPVEVQDLKEAVEEKEELSEEPEEEQALVEEKEPSEEEQASQEEQVSEKEVVPEEEPEVDTMPEENILISPHNIFYFTLKDTIRQVHSNQKGIVHFAIAGGEDRIALAIAKKLIKELNNINYFTANSIAKIHGGKLNGVDLEEKIKKLVGGCILILNAQEMESETVEKIQAAMEKYKNDIVFVMTGEYDELDCWFAHYPEVEQQVCYKVKL